MNVIDERILFHNLFRFLNLASNLEEVYGILWCFVESIEISQSRSSLKYRFDIDIYISGYISAILICIVEISLFKIEILKMPCRWASSSDDPIIL